MPNILVPTVTIAFDTITCGKCGIVFAAPDWFVKKRMEDHESWFCPNGHERHFIGKTEAENLRDELARERHQLDQVRANRDYWMQKQTTTERSLRATKAVVTRTKKKIVAGSCPCCSRKFKDLAVHMKVEHPNYDPDKAVAALEAKGVGGLRDGEGARDG